MITIETIGSTRAIHLESGIAAEQGKKGSTTKSALPILCRKLVAAGFDISDLVHVVSKSFDSERRIPIYKRDRPLAVWAALDCAERDKHGPRMQKHVPYSGPVKAKEAPQGALGCVAPAASVVALKDADGEPGNAARVSSEVR